jgi:hypothetical protein
MPYFNVIIFDIFCISIIALFLNNNCKIKLNYAFLISLCLCGLFLYTAYLIFPIEYLRYFVFTYLIIVIFATFKCFLNNKISKENLNLLLEFFVLSFLISLFSWNRFYLDEDELNHWGKIVKYFHIVQNPDFKELTVYLYHKPFLPLIHFFNSFFSAFREDLSIFSNNLFIISSFYFVFYHEKISFVKRISLLIIFYLCLNNLSFGLVSIYADPIISVLYLSLIIHIYCLKDNLKLEDFFIIFILSVSLFLFHRSGVIYVLFAIFFWFILHGYKNKKFLALFFFVNLILISYVFVYRLDNYNLFDLYSLKSFLSKFLFVDTYFSDFGVSFNTILSFIGISNYKFPELNINVLFWLVIILLLLVYNCNKNLKIIFFLILQFFLYSVIIYIFKIKTDDLSILVYGRYIGIFLLSAFLFAIFIHSTLNNKFNPTVLLITFFVLLSVTPNKTYGFLLSNNFFLQQQQNQDFWNQKQAIKKIYSNLNPDYKVFVVQGSAKSKTTLYHPSMPFSLMNFELYPLIHTWMIKSISIFEYENDLQTFSKSNIIFYNLTLDEKNKVNELNNREDLIYINFD